MNRDEILAKIEIRMEEIFDDDMMFEQFLSVEQAYSDSELTLFLGFGDDHFRNFMSKIIPSFQRLMVIH